MKLSSTVTMLGDGAWGTAVASLLAYNGYHVKLWCFNPLVAESIIKTRSNSLFLPNIVLPEQITPITNLSEAITDTHYIFIAIPIIHMRSVISQLDRNSIANRQFILLNKGIEKNTLLLPSEILTHILGSVSYTIISGPSFARDLALQQLTGVSIAAPTRDQAYTIQELVDNNYFRSFYTADYRGCQVAAALKNILALGMGILDSLGYSDNTKNFFLTMGIAEIAQLICALGGNRETVYSLAGIGDIMLTALGSQSKNLALGKRIGSGETLAHIRAASNNNLPESINTLTSLAQLMQKHTLSLPLCEIIHDIVFKQKSPHELVKTLMK
jgi:glycerol-3-phosphate dehydrogenase (NAD(P)+)